MSATIIAVANQKGGTGKTTTCENLGIGLANKGKRVLLVDTDPQASLTIALGYPRPDDLPVTLTDLMTNVMQERPVNPEETILSHTEDVDLIPASIMLSGLEVSLVNAMSRETVLKQVLESVKSQYDYILLDCMPSIGMLTINALTAATSVLVPIQCEYYALEGLSQLIHTIDLVRDRLNKRLKMEGVVFTMYDARTNLSLQVVENVKDNLNQNIYKTIIPRNVRLAEAPSYGLPINLYDPKSKGTESYMLLAEEVINKGE